MIWHGDGRRPYEPQTSSQPNIRPIDFKQVD